jgi:putative Holliday junction resolvase
MAINHSVLALDVGDKRIGVALATLAAKIASPLATLDNNEQVLVQIKRIVKEEDVKEVIIGLPRDVHGAETEQTKTVKAFARKLKTEIDLPQHFQDESLTSVRAEEELSGRGQPYQKADVDALAATYILEDWLADKISQTEAL